MTNIFLSCDSRNDIPVHQPDLVIIETDLFVGTKYLVRLLNFERDFHYSIRSELSALTSTAEVLAPTLTLKRLRFKPSKGGERRNSDIYTSFHHPSEIPNFHQVQVSPRSSPPIRGGSNLSEGRNTLSQMADNKVKSFLFYFRPMYYHSVILIVAIGCRSSLKLAST